MTSFQRGGKPYDLTARPGLRKTGASRAPIHDFGGIFRRNGKYTQNDRSPVSGDRVPIGPGLWMAAEARTSSSNAPSPAEVVLLKEKEKLESRVLLVGTPLALNKLERKPMTITPLNVLA